MISKKISLCDRWKEYEGSLLLSLMLSYQPHNGLVEEVVRRLAENDLYVKLEKCKWKVRKVGFLEVMIEQKGIKMEEDKVKGVLD